MVWAIIASIFVGGTLLFLLGIYLIARKAANKATDLLSEIPKDVVKESFHLGKELLKNKLRKN